MSSSPHAIEAQPWQAAFLARHRLPETYLASAARWFEPLASQLAAHQNGAVRPLLLGLNGSQGSGKTTLSDYLLARLREVDGLNVVSLSLDDFYHTRAERERLANIVHPLLVTRGVPGTHDIGLLQATLDRLLYFDRPVAVPRFDKAVDDRRPPEQWDEVAQAPDIVLLEGWCLGAHSVDPAELEAPINDLEREEDPAGAWRCYVDRCLREQFEPLYARIERWVMMRAPGFETVYQWRLEQEEKLAASRGRDSAGVMSATEIARFVQFFERLTRRCLATLPPRVDVLYELDEHRTITSARGLPE